MTPERTNLNPEAMPFMVADHERRLTMLEREKLATEVALVKRDVADIKNDVAEMKVTMNTLTNESQNRKGGQASWKAVWLYVVGGLVALAAIASPFIALATQ